MYAENSASRGAKRICQDCSAKYYDLQRTPIICPKCHAEFVEPPKARRASSAGMGRARAMRRAEVPAPFAEASASNDEAPAKVADDGDVDDQNKDDATEDEPAEAEEDEEESAH
jgi:uncharacterized protein (TIGR02300 family)